MLCSLKTYEVLANVYLTPIGWIPADLASVESEMAPTISVTESLFPFGDEAFAYALRAMA